MKTLAILGIVFSSIWILVGMSVLGNEGVWSVVLTFAYFLAMSIAVLYKK